MPLPLGAEGIIRQEASRPTWPTLLLLGKGPLAERIGGPTEPNAGGPQRGGNMIDLALIVGGPVLWLITKNRRWLILTVLGIAWFVIDVLYIAVQLSGR